MTIEHISDGDKLLAIIVRANHTAQGVQFVTGNEEPQQLGIMGHPAGKIIVPHFHQNTSRTISRITESLFIKSGKLRVDFYHEDHSVLTSRILGPLDMIMLIQGGHGFEVLEELQMLEIKQGPYAGENDKIRFSTTKENK